MLIALSTLSVFGTAWKERKNAFVFFWILNKMVYGTEDIAVSLVQSAGRLNSWSARTFTLANGFLKSLRFGLVFSSSSLTIMLVKSEWCNGRESQKTQRWGPRNRKTLKSWFTVAYLRSINLWFDSVWCIIDLVECLILFLFIKLSTFLPILAWKHAENTDSFSAQYRRCKKYHFLWTHFYDFWSTVPVGKWNGHRFPPSLAKGMTFFLSNIFESGIEF